MWLADTESALIAARAAESNAKLALAGSILAALISVVVAVITQLSNRKTQRELKDLELNNNEKLAKLNAALGKRKSEDDARRDYDYEARKRLYRECEPLLFRLAEGSENALHRIFSLARTARDGDLEQDRSWLNGPGYYMASTIYNLMVPIVIFRLLQNRLTLVDLTVDRRISNQYLTAKLLYITFTEDFVLSRFEPELHYQPFVAAWEKMRAEQPTRYWRQGLTLGRLDAAIDGMIHRSPDNTERCITFGEFEPSFYKDLTENGVESCFAPFIDVFSYFHPARRPILWRILVVQAHLHARLMRQFVHHGATGFLTSIPNDFSGNDLARLDWRSPQDQLDESLITEPVRVARNYISERLLIEPDKSATPQP
jgi:hypothetical protein